SLECRNCHNYEYMDFTRQSVRAQNMHSKYLADKSKTCIDCHKGIAHKLPNIPPESVSDAGPAAGAAQSVARVEPAKVEPANAAR
ncbi:MAG: NapC/NirT family cytochrome c, partial [Achromobacter piechaudii]